MYVIDEQIDPQNEFMIIIDINCQTCIWVLYTYQKWMPSIFQGKLWEILKKPMLIRYLFSRCKLDISNNSSVNGLAIKQVVIRIRVVIRIYK